MTISANFPNVQPSLLLDFANAKQLPPSVNFTRATTATYYDGSTTAMAEQNLVTYSQDFSNTSYWTQDQVTLTGSQTAPDGTSTAFLFTDNANNTDHRCYMFPAQIGAPFYTGSVYLKNGTRRYALLRLQNGATTAGAIFDLQTGAVASTGGSGYFSSSITGVGNGWYRCTVTSNAFSAGVGNFVVAMSNTATYSDNIQYVGTGATMSAWGAQLEQRSSATAYTATTTQAITNYIPVLLTAGGGQPRFDHNPTTSESLGLLIEEQRTNNLSQSNDLSNWGSIGAQAPGKTVVPTGELSGVNANRTGPNNLYTILSVSNATTYTFSVYAKAGFGSQVNFGVESGFGTYAVAGFNLSSGIAPSPPSGTTVSMTPVGNGWYRLTMTGTTTSTSMTLHIAATTADYTNGVWVWGAQLEVGAFATSYISTNGAAATRAADSAVMTGGNFSSWFNNSEGTLYVEASPQTLSTNSMGMASLTNTAGSSNSIAIYYTGGNVVDVESLVNNTAQYTYLIPRGSPPTKVAHGYKVNNSNVGLNGTAYTPDTVCLVPPVNTLTIGTIYDAASFPCNGTIRKFAYYPIRVTDAQLAALTS